ncbi:phylloplanin-like [Cynara cardunculus var. scolymus]|uniref:Pollen Ole e 1 allergen/extensin n=1 Tax=Cynara cardunculus var. scolymus TaxID=59895 RepID=A0A103XJP0_CYNCS|nr:phylloplanin-like [Cynara cardunculus var. scolymus]KVH91986.1 Pollen Ole e 1 allergen/extensin [Cynara cardunculus var. scolymus]
MAMGSLKYVAFLLMVVSTSHIADAQLSRLLNLINISGLVSCSLNGNIIANPTTPIPPFPNALVEVSCGGNVISSAITNGSGMFNIILNPLQFLLSNLLSSNCNVHVVTPLSNCNATLPSTGILQSPLQFIGTTARGLFNVFNLAPETFQLIGI